MTAPVQGGLSAVSSRGSTPFLWMLRPKSFLSSDVNLQLGFSLPKILEDIEDENKTKENTVRLPVAFQSRVDSGSVEAVFFENGQYRR